MNQGAFHRCAMRGTMGESVDKECTACHEFAKDGFRFG
jgi:cytochrome c2